ELAKERYDRIMAAINLQEPDRVPLRGFGGDIVPAYYGITQKEFCFEYEKGIKAIEKYLTDFPFDWPSAAITGLDGRVFSVAFSEYPEVAVNTTFITGPMHEVLGDKYYRFPGMEIAEIASPQFIGGTFMQPDEYDELIENPPKFVAEKVLPRACRNLDTPQKTMATMVKLGIEFTRFGSAGREIAGIAARLGYPSIPMGGAYAPLDIIGDFLRGIENVLLDIRRYPDKVKQAAEALVEPIINYALSFKKRGFKWVMIPLHLNEYLSPKLYNEFYWPTLKKVILRLLEEGMQSQVFFEGRHDAHLETILELPKGWGIAYFEKTDLVKAKKVLEGHTCVMGGIPISLIVGGTPDSIKEYMKNLIEQVKPKGGVILSPNIGTAPKETPIENIYALIEAVEKYG
ncbi:uroporphyrinogen decarboxylase family protein, partial [Thermovenabulum sp.]|uniref:uroporphyrinogen decarboxylase family protein n=1 Tax=Thermovenabulum sp. TaxID=3100335 RepID=UPI003C7A6D4F